jgi:hypothetical protein
MAAKNVLYLFGEDLGQDGLFLLLFFFFFFFFFFFWVNGILCNFFGIVL